MLEKISIKSGSNNLAGNLFLPAYPKIVGLLMLHGGGSATKERYLSLQKLLEEQGFISLSFDFQGVGESTGVFEEGSLNNRLLDTEAAFKRLSKSVEKIVVIAGSMAGHIAIRLTEKVKMEGLILFYPAAYTQKSEDKNLGPEFSNIIRQENSFLNSPVFKILKNFKRPILILFGEEDKVIPEQVKISFKKSLKKSDKYITFPNAGHNLLSVVGEKGFQEITEFLEKVKGQI